VKQLNCKEFKGIVVDVLYNYDQLTEEDKRLFHAHLTTCPACAGEYEEMAGVLALMDQRDKPEMGEEFWDSYYLRLLEKMKESEEKEKNKIKNKIWSWLKKWWENFTFDIQRLRWVLYPAAALLLVVLGITIGRYLYLPPVPEKGEELISSALPSERKFNPAVTDHFENLRPMLIDYANYTAEENEASEEELVTVDKKTLKKLVLQNYLLKKIAARENDLSLKQLLVDLEMILLEISNIEPNSGRNETILRVQDILDKSDILFKMKVYNKHKNNRKTLQISTI
jgi:hypothetical protein